MRARDSAAPVLSLRQLNRALLARQMLLERERTNVVTAIERLGALQAQWPPAPYVALWSRLERFAIADLEKALAARAVVKSSLMRGTLHLVSARDYPAYAVAAPEARKTVWASTQRQLINFLAKTEPAARRYRDTGTLPIPASDKVHAALLRYAAKPQDRNGLIAFMAKTTKMPPELAQYFVWQFVAAHGMLVHVPSSGAWAARRSGELIAARTALPAMKVPSFSEAATHTVKRHLAAFGPATVEDVASWTHLRTPPIREAIDKLGRAVVTFHDERGRTLYDLVRSPRPSADVPAPIRFLPKWDSTLLAYTPQERVRILDERHRKAVIAKNGDVAQSVLVDGMVAATWTARRSGKTQVVEVAPLFRIGRSDRGAIVEEGERLARFIAPEASSHGARIAA